MKGGLLKMFQKLMKQSFVIGAVILLCSMSNTAIATMAIPPATGDSYLMEWSNGLGQIDSINGNTANTDWSITISESSIMSYIKVKDLGGAGDEFVLYLDNALIAWTNVSYDSDGYFMGEYDNVPLAIGTHIFTFNLVKIVGDSGNAGAQFSGVVPAPVPEPTTMLLLGLGLMGLAGVRRRMR